MAPPTRSLGALLALVGAVAGASAALRQLPPGAKDLCVFELPTNASCSLENAGTGYCKIYMLPKDSCFQNWQHCWDNTTFIEGIHFTQQIDEESNTTSLKVYNYEGKRLLITTLRPEKTWWQVDVPEGEHNITITGLLGHLNETSPITNTVYCDGCPPPRVSYIALRNLHRFEILVSPLEENIDGDVFVSMASSNETGFVKRSCERFDIDLIKVTDGMTNELLSVDNVYSTEFCFLIKVNFSSSMERYRCKVQENMTEPSLRLVKTSIGLPTKWIVGVVLLLICLALGSLVPVAIHRGVLRVPCGRSAAHSCKRREDEGEGGRRALPRNSGSLLDGATAAFGGAAAANADDEEYSLVRKGTPPISVDDVDGVEGVGGAKRRSAPRQLEGTVKYNRTVPGTIPESTERFYGEVQRE